MSKNTKASRRIEFYNRFQKLGLSFDEIETLRRAEMTLHRWSGLECGDANEYASWAIERDEVTQKPFMVRYSHNEAKSRKTPIADRESGALKRIAKVLESHPDLAYYYQTDPRGCALYLLRKGIDILPGESIDSVYTRGFAVCRD